MSKVEPIEYTGIGAWKTTVYGVPITGSGLEAQNCMLKDKLNELIEAHNTHVESCQEKHTPDKSVFSEDYYSLARITNYRNRNI